MSDPPVRCRRARALWNRTEVFGGLVSVVGLVRASNRHMDAGIASGRAKRRVALAGWTDPDIRFWHFRDKDGQEVDLVMTLGNRTWGMEVKATSTPGRSAGRGMARLAALCGNDFEGGILFYNGRDILPLAGQDTLAVPVSELWTR